MFLSSAFFFICPSNALDFTINNRGGFVVSLFINSFKHSNTAESSLFPFISTATTSEIYEFVRKYGIDEEAYSHLSITC